MVKFSRGYFSRIGKIGIKKRWEKEHSKVRVAEGISPEKAAIHAYLCGDGFIKVRTDKWAAGHHDIRIWPDNRELAEFIVNLFKKEFNIEPKIRNLHNHFRVEIGNKPAFLNLIKLGNYSTTGWKIPKNLSKCALKEWIKAFFDCEANVDLNNKVIALKSINFEGLREIREKLLLFNIESKLYGPYQPRNEKHSKYGILVIKGKNIEQYRKLINFNHPDKKEKLDLIQ